MCQLLYLLCILVLSSSEVSGQSIYKDCGKRSLSEAYCVCNGNEAVECKCGCDPQNLRNGPCCCDCRSPSSSSGGCFPGDAAVFTDSGRYERMKNLVVGQRILCVQNGKRVFSEVRTFFRRESARNATFLTLITEKGHRLSLSEKHVVFTSTNKSTNMKPRLARAVKPGDYIFSTENCPVDTCQERVLQIFVSKEQGMYAPLTNTGTAVVNGILASCFGKIINMDAAHLIVFPLRWFPWLLEPWQKGGLSPVLSAMEYLIPKSWFGR